MSENLDILIQADRLRQRLLETTYEENDQWQILHAILTVENHFAYRFYREILKDRQETFKLISESSGNDRICLEKLVR